MHAIKRCLTALTVTLLLGATAPAPAHAYNGSGAAAYADKWAKARNPNFSADCTNFVSQAMHEGGKYPFRYGGDPWYAWWQTYAIGGGWAYTQYWSVSWQLRNFLAYDAPGGIPAGTAAGTATNYYTPSSMVTGDVLFYDWGTGEGISHANMQVGIGNDPNYPNGQTWYGNYVDQHITDRYHAFWSLRPYNANYKTTKIYFMHISSAN